MAYRWYDLISHRLERGRPCFKLCSSGGNREYGVLIDSISIGSTRSDFDLSLYTPNLLTKPGQPFSLDLVVTNNSPYYATGKLMLVIEDANEPQSWLLPYMPPGGVYSETVTLTTPDSGETLRLEAVVGKPEIDDTPERNTRTFTLFPEGIPMYFPFVVRS